MGEGKGEGTLQNMAILDRLSGSKLYGEGNFSDIQVAAPEDIQTKTKKKSTIRSVLEKLDCGNEQREGPPQK